MIMTAAGMTALIVSALSQTTYGVGPTGPNAINPLQSPMTSFTTSSMSSSSFPALSAGEADNGIDPWQYMPSGQLVGTQSTPPIVSDACKITEANQFTINGTVSAGKRHLRHMLNDSACANIVIVNGDFSIPRSSTERGVPYVDISGNGTHAVTIWGSGTTVLRPNDANKSRPYGVDLAPLIFVNISRNRVRLTNLEINGDQLDDTFTAPGAAPIPADPYEESGLNGPERLLGIGYTSNNPADRKTGPQLGTVIDGVTLKYAARECVRIMNSSQNVYLLNSKILRCGTGVFQKDGSIRTESNASVNGEGIYIGTDIVTPGGSTDVVDNITIEGNTIETFASECVEVKERSQRVTIRRNLCKNSGYRRGPASGAMINFDGNGNTAERNTICAIAPASIDDPVRPAKRFDTWPGAGIRAGADNSAYGKNNKIIKNLIGPIENSALGARWPENALRFKQGNQEIVCGNTSAPGLNVASYVGIPASAVPVLAECPAPYNSPLTAGQTARIFLPMMVAPASAVVEWAKIICSRVPAPVSVPSLDFNYTYAVEALPTLVPTHTPEPLPTNTAVPPTATTVPSTATPMPPTNTPTPQPTATATATTTPLPPTSTPTSAPGGTNGMIVSEAESFSLILPMAVGIDTNASNSQFVSVASGSNDTNCASGNATGWATYTFTTATARNHKIWARTLAVSGSTDSFCFQLDNNAIEQWSVPTNAAWQWNEVKDGTYYLSAGNHTIKFRYRETNTKLDKVVITSDLAYVPTGTGPGSGGGTGPTATPVPPTATRAAATSTPTATPTPGSGGSGNYYLEAEAGSPAAPLSVANDSAASNGQYIWSATAKDTNCTNGNTTGWATYTVNVPAGTYKLWGRGIAPSGSNDSFCVQIDSGTISSWSMTISTTWVWDNMVSGTFNLSAGTHTIRVRYREDGAKLDRLLLTSNTSFTP